MKPWIDRNQVTAAASVLLLCLLWLFIADTNPCHPANHGGDIDNHGYRDEFLGFDNNNNNNTNNNDDHDDHDDHDHDYYHYFDNDDINKNNEIPTITIGVDIMGHDVNMPLLGAGTWQYNDTIAYESVCKAFALGYTMVDTAWGYRNQKGVGQAIRDCWTNQNKSRADLFVLTKIPGGLTRHQVWAAHEQNLQELDLMYVDHLMVHFPADWDVSPHRATRERRQETWRALQEIYDTNGARSIGISHYCPQHIMDIMEVSTTVSPSINQVEYHVGSGDVDQVMETCRQHNITFMSFSPLCGPCNYDPQDSLISGTLVSEIAAKYNVTGSQVSLRFIVQQALEDPSRKMGGVIPKSNNIEHLTTNRDIFDWTLSQEDMTRLFQASKPEAEAGDCSVP